MAAARTGQLEVMRQLIARRADVNAREDRFHQTALMWSAGHPEQVKLLIEHGADVRARTKIWDVVNPMYSEISVGGSLLEKVGEYLSKQGGQNALFFAVQQDDVESTNLLLEAGVDVNEAAANGSTALLLALYKWQPEEWQGRYGTLLSKFTANLRIANILLDHGARVDITDSVGVTPLRGAVLGLTPQARLHFWSDFDINFTSKPPPIRTLPIDRQEGLVLVKRLLDLKADPLVVTRLPTVTSGPEVARLERDPLGSSPLHIAARSGNPEVVQLLLQYGSDPTVVAQNGHDPLSIAVKANDLPVVKLLVEYGADPKRLYSPTDKLSDPPADVLDFVVRNASARRNQTLLHIAAVEGADKVIAFLVEQGLSLSARNDHGETALVLADGQERARYIEAKRSLDFFKRVYQIDYPQPVLETSTSDALKKLMRSKNAVLSCLRKVQGNSVPEMSC